MSAQKERWTADQIKALRKRLGLRVEELAIKMRLTVYTIQSWECGRKFPSGPATLVLDALERQSCGQPALLFADELQTA